MLLYRVFAKALTATPGAPGSAEYLHRPQGTGRWDNPNLYDTWYLSTSPEGAIAETFGNLPEWTSAMFEVPYFPTGRRALATFSVPDDLSIVNLDDAHTLLKRGMRPTQVVIRNPSYTQGQAAAAFAERNTRGQPTWTGISWWSYHRHFFTNIALWSTPSSPAPLTFVSEDPLSLTTPAVAEAAQIMNRPL
jgi:hypothetical protein